MFKRIAVAAVAFACVSVALGAAEKIRWFDNLAELNPNADGMAILNHKLGLDNTVVQVILSDLSPNTPYVVALREPSTWSPVEGTDDVLLDPVSGTGTEFFFVISAGTEGQLSTDGKGHLTFHGSTTQGSGDFSDSDVLIILYTDWDAAFPLDPERLEFPDLRIPVRLIGYNGTPAPE